MLIVLIKIGKISTQTFNKDPGFGWGSGADVEFPGINCLLGVLGIFSLDQTHSMWPIFSSSIDGFRKSPSLNYLGCV